jgi:hypothetical protein
MFLSTDEISPQLALVNLYLATQRYDDAEDTLKLALERYSNDVILQTSLINLYIKYTRAGKQWISRRLFAMPSHSLIT